MTWLSVMACIPSTGDVKTRGHGSPLHKDRYPFIPPLPQNKTIRDQTVPKTELQSKEIFKRKFKRLKMHHVEELTQTLLADLSSL